MKNNQSYKAKNNNQKVRIMRNILTIALIVGLSGCASQYQAAGQNYRLKGEESTIEIQGKLNDSAFGNKNNAEISFNGELQINVPLDYRYFGDASGKPYKGKPTSASCTAKQLSSSTEVRCMVFVDNERTVTLTF